MQEYLTPFVKPGDQLKTVFAKTVSIRGQGFDEYVKRVSGTATDHVLSVTSTAIRMQEDYRYDGRPAGSGMTEIRDRGSTICFEGKCAINDQTSGSMFIPYLWGPIPADIAKGSHWSAVAPAPWEIGPKGVAEVRVTRLDPAAGLITLRRDGRGQGPSSDDAGLKTLTITVDGKPVEVSLVPHGAHWEGLATFSRGMTLSDEIIVTRAITLVVANGQEFEGEERVYTLLFGAA